MDELEQRKNSTGKQVIGLSKHVVYEEYLSTFIYIYIYLYISIYIYLYIYGAAVAQ